MRVRVKILGYVRVRKTYSDNILYEFDMSYVLRSLESIVMLAHSMQLGSVDDDVDVLC